MVFNFDFYLFPGQVIHFAFYKPFTGKRCIYFFTFSTKKEKENSNIKFKKIRKCERKMTMKKEEIEL